MREKDSYGVEGLKKDLSVAETHLKELEERYRQQSSIDPDDAAHLRSLKEEIRETEKDIDLKKELIMILGNEEFCYEHGDIFDRFLNLEGEPFEDEIIRVGYPLRGLGLALLMELRDRYYKWKEKK
jgi:hypothetical protein